MDFLTDFIGVRDFRVVGDPSFLIQLHRKQYIIITVKNTGYKVL